MTAWPPANGLSTKLVDRKATILPIHGSTLISAPASLVWSILLNTTDYPKWNTFVPKVTVDDQPAGTPKNDAILQLNTHMVFHVVMDSKRPQSYTDTQLRVCDFSTPEQHSDYLSQELLDLDGSYSSDLNQVYRIAWRAEGGFAARGLKSERYHEIVVRGQECEVRTWECQGGPLARAVKYMYKNLLLRKFDEWCRDLKQEAERQVKEKDPNQST